MEGFPFYALIAASITNFLSLLTYEPQTRLIGASGLVYLLAGFWLVMYFIIERNKNLIKRIIRVLGVGMVILFPSTFDHQVSYRTHLIGLIIGILYAIIYYFLNRKDLHKFDVYVEEEIESPPITWH